MAADPAIFGQSHWRWQRRLTPAGASVGMALTTDDQIGLSRARIDRGMQQHDRTLRAGEDQRPKIVARRLLPPRPATNLPAHREDIRPG